MVHRRYFILQFSQLEQSSKVPKSDSSCSHLVIQPIEFYDSPMFKSRGFAKLITISAALMLLPNMAYAAQNPSPGKTCKNYKEKVVYKSLTYTCTKTGNKLIWSKGTPVIQDKNAPATSKSNSSASPVKAYLERWKDTGSQALTSYALVFPKKEPKYEKIEIIWRISENVAPEIVSTIKTRYQNTFNFWSSYVQFTEPLQVIIGNLDDIAFVCKWRDSYLQMSDSNCQTNFRNDKSRNWDAHTTQLNSKKTDFYFISDSRTLNQMDFVPRIEHEFFHNVQHAKNSNYKSIFPCWAEEAGAEYFGNLVSSKGNAEVFLRLRSFSINSRFGAITQGISTPEKWKEWLYSADMVSNVPNSSEWGCARVQMEGIYHYGLLATEYLHLKFGVSGLLDLYEESGRMGWSAAIEKFFGTNKDQAYAEIADYMNREYLISKSANWAGPTCVNGCYLNPN